MIRFGVPLRSILLLGRYEKIAVSRDISIGNNYLRYSFLLDVQYRLYNYVTLICHNVLNILNTLSAGDTCELLSDYIVKGHFSRLCQNRNSFRLYN